MNLALFKRGALTALATAPLMDPESRGSWPNAADVSAVGQMSSILLMLHKVGVTISRVIAGLCLIMAGAAVAAPAPRPAPPPDHLINIPNAADPSPANASARDTARVVLFSLERNNLPAARGAQPAPQDKTSDGLPASPTSPNR